MNPTLPIPLPDRDYGDESRRADSGMCVLCRYTQAMPDDDVCEDCWAEIIGERILEEMGETP